MNPHLTDGALRAALDGEQNPAESAHLAGCESCQQRQNQINAQKIRVAALFTPPARNQAPDAPHALRHFHLRYSQKEIPMFKKVLTSSVFRYVALAALLIAITFSFPQTQALASQLLSLFRVQQVKILPLDFSAMQGRNDRGTIGQAMSQLLSDSVTASNEPGAPVSAADAAQASQLAGFTVRLPAEKTPTKISVQNGGNLTFTINYAKAQALLDEAGRSDLQLPPSIDGKKVEITVPASVNAMYGTGCTPEKDGEFSYKDCTVLAEIPSPIVNAPAELNVAQLAQVALEFTGMSAQEAAAYTASVDWTTTLVIPVPRYANYEEVSVQGVNGVLVAQSYSENNPGYMLVWVKDGIIYALSGQGDNAQALELANSIK